MNNFCPYINEDGFITTKPNANPKPGEGNGWMQTGLMLACFPNEYFQFVTASKLQSTITRSIRDDNWLLWRSPYKKNPDDNENFDDYWGYLYICKLLWRHGSIALLSYGIQYNWCFDVQRPGKWSWRYWFGRFPQFAPFVRLCAFDEKPGFIDSAIFITSIFFDAMFIGSDSGNMKACIRVMALKGKDPAIDRACNFWISRIKKRYGKIGKSFVGYLDATHPLTEFDCDRFTIS